jgi:hypothetical protein
MPEIIWDHLVPQYVGPMELRIAMKHQNIESIHQWVPLLLGHQGWKVWLADSPNE